jgi:hypothetical protein
MRNVQHGFHHLSTHAFQHPQSHSFVVFILDMLAYRLSAMVQDGARQHSRASLTFLPQGYVFCK